MDAITYALSKKYTDSKISQSTGLHRQIVTSLPTTGDEKIIYMVRVSNDNKDSDNYNEYMWIDSNWELIGNTRVDLSDYYNKTQVDTALNGKADTSDIPTSLSQLSADATHRVVTDTEKSTWNGKSNFSGSYNDLSNKPTIPTALSQLTADATHRLVTDTEKSTWNGKANSSTSLAGYGITDAYTKSEVNAKISELDQAVGRMLYTYPFFVKSITVPSGISLQTLSVPSGASSSMFVYNIDFYCKNQSKVFLQWSPTKVGGIYANEQDCWKVSVNNQTGGSITLNNLNALVTYSA